MVISRDIGRSDRLGGRLPACLAAQEVEDNADTDDDGQRHDLRELVLQPLVGKLSAARLSSGFPPPPNQFTPKPGQISATVASSAQNVGTTEQIHAPAMPPGTR